MTRPPSTFRVLLTALLAAWLPLCCCQAAGVAHLAMSLAGLAGADEPGCSCCQGDAPADAPAPVIARVACCSAAVKIAPRPDRWSPDRDAPGTPIPLAVAHAVLAAPPQAAPPASPSDAPPLSASQTLLRRHCALII